jgi:RNA polymerase sigma-70 factor (ECF subfamily)
MNEELATLTAIAQGDADAFARWVSGAEAQVRRALRPFAEVCDTEAVLQEALLRVWQVAPRFRHDGKPNGLLRFAVTAARNVAVSELRRSSPSKAQLDALERELAVEAAVAPSLPDPLLRKAIAECRRKLPGKPAQALAQRLEGGFEDDAVLAQRLGMSLNTFLQNFTRARKFLMECLKKAGVELDAEVAP